jgi:hypothetical protein
LIFAEPVSGTKMTLPPAVDIDLPFGTPITFSVKCEPDGAPLPRSAVSAFASSARSTPTVGAVHAVIAIASAPPKIHHRCFVCRIVVSSAFPSRRRLSIARTSADRRARTANRARTSGRRHPTMDARRGWGAIIC